MFAGNNQFMMSAIGNGSAWEKNIFAVKFKLPFGILFLGMKIY